MVQRQLTLTGKNLIQGPLVLSGLRLEDGGEEGLRVEEATDPHCLGQLQVDDPILEGWGQGLGGQGLGGQVNWCSCQERNTLTRA